MKKENLLKITDLRHELHMYPELSMQERETAERIKTFLRDNTHFRIVDRGDWLTEELIEETGFTHLKRGENPVKRSRFGRIWMPCRSRKMTP